MQPAAILKGSQSYRVNRQATKGHTEPSIESIVKHWERPWGCLEPSGRPCIHLISPTLYLLLPCGRHIQISLISFNNYTQSDLLSLPLPPQDRVSAGHLCCQRDSWDQMCFCGLPQVQLSSARHNWQSKCRTNCQDGVKNGLPKFQDKVHK